MEEDSSALSGKKASVRVSKKKIGIWLMVGIVLTGIVIAGLVFDRLAIAVVPSTRARVVSNVCTIDDIATFNKDFAEDSYTVAIENIANRTDSGSDVNCVFMEYRYFYDRQQYTKAREKVINLEALVGAGNAIDNRIDGVLSIQAIRQNIATVKGLEDGKSVDYDSETQ